MMLKLHALIRNNAQELAELIVKENGKNITEALADVAKGNETVEWACSLPQLAQGNIMRVSTGVTCMDRKDPIGVVASIVPFNFPLMVPMVCDIMMMSCHAMSCHVLRCSCVVHAVHCMIAQSYTHSFFQWTVPIALVMGNVVILKPSEKVPLTMRRVAELFQEAGFPDGVFNMVQGTKEAVEAIIDHLDVKAVTFVGSTPVAKMVADRCRALNKRVTALGGAKNHLVALKDCEIEGASSDIVASFAGCAGQRCMAASCLLLVREQNALLNNLVTKASKIKAGSGPCQLGPVIDAASCKKILSFIHQAELEVPRYSSMVVCGITRKQVIGLDPQSFCTNRRTTRPCRKKSLAQCFPSTLLAPGRKLLALRTPIPLKMRLRSTPPMAAMQNGSLANFVPAHVGCQHWHSGTT